MANENTSDENAQSPKQAITSQTSTKALAVVALAVILGFVLIWIVSSSNDEKTKSAVVQSTTPTTTTKAPSNNTDSSTTTAAPTTTAPAVANAKTPSEVNVLILNGSNIAGVAAKVSDEIAKAGYKTLTPGNEESKSSGSTVYYKTGFEADAKQLATNVLPGILKALQISQPVAVKQFPLSAPTTWDQENLIGANLVVSIGNG